MSGAQGYMGRNKASLGVLLPVSSLSARFFLHAPTANRPLMDHLTVLQGSAILRQSASSKDTIAVGC